MSHTDVEEQLRSEIAQLRRELEDTRKANTGHADPLAHPKRPSSRTLLLGTLAALMVLGIAFAAGLLPRSRRQAEIVAEAKATSQDLPVVTVARAKRAATSQELTLPANIQAVTEAPILARADGYLKRRYADIGDRVRAGQLLAEIEAPELDQQVQQAKAAVAQAHASVEQARAALDQGKVNQDLARITAERWNNLLMKGAVSRQENDQYQTQFRSQSANVQALDRARAAAEQNLAAAEANHRRLNEVQGYRQVRAPFAGVVTVRNVDVGALITSGQTLLYRIAQTNPLRAYINVPQSEADGVRMGDTAALEVAQLSGRSFEGRIARTASALDPASRTLLAEVQLRNDNGLLMPGMYAQVALRHSQSHPPLRIPGDTVSIGTKGPQVATIDANHRVHFKQVVLGRDFGQEVEILQGIGDGELLIRNPDDQVRDGVEVKPERAAEAQ